MEISDCSLPKRCCPNLTAVKMGRYKQDKENAALMQGAYLAYVTKSKRKFDKVLRSIYTFRPSRQQSYR